MWQLEVNEKNTVSLAGEGGREREKPCVAHALRGLCEPVTVSVAQAKVSYDRRKVIILISSRNGNRV